VNSLIIPPIMTFTRLFLAFAVFGGFALGQPLWAKKTKASDVNSLIATPQHLKESLTGTTMLLTKLNVGPTGPEVAKAILAAGLDQVTQFVPFPSENAREPEPTKRVAPVYPYELRRKGVSGSTSFLMLIGADGRVKSLYCYQSTHPWLADAAAEALNAWKFKPATVKGTAMPVLANQTMDFSAD
jgi:TonB family protein